MPQRSMGVKKNYFKLGIFLPNPLYEFTFIILMSIRFLINPKFFSCALNYHVVNGLKHFFLPKPCIVNAN